MSRLGRAKVSERKKDYLDGFTAGMECVIEHLERKAYALERCDSTNDYAEAQRIRRLVSEVRSMMEAGPPDA